jgi:predicted dehydrogenase/nucleoside-diphosphate-sugar epimerase
MKSPHIDNHSLRVVVIGGGKMGRHHIEAIRNNTHSRLVGIADPVANLSDLLSTLGKEVTLSRDPADLLNQTKPDIVHICTPPGTHTALSELALRSGAHIYVEKPFASLPGDARRILDLAAEHGKKVCAGHQLLMEYPGVRTQDLVPLIGDIVHVESYFSFRQVRRNISPVEQLIDILPHPVYMLQHFLKRDNISEDLTTIKSVHVDPDGEVRGLIEFGGLTGVLIVSLNARPIESYLRIVGTNGAIYADFVLGRVDVLPGPGASAPSILLNPFLKSKQIVSGSVRGITRLLFASTKGYPGLSTLIDAFYDSVSFQTPSPTLPDAILDTVNICHTIETKLVAAEKEAEEKARTHYLANESPAADEETYAGTVAVTGGTGFLGRHIVTVLRDSGWRVKVLCRRVPSFKIRLGGIDYLQCDLSQPLSPSILRDVHAVIHCAAETAGDQDAHQKNSIDATQNILDAIRQEGIHQFIHMSSIAVLKPSLSGDRPLVENDAVDFDNIGRGPYVWGKAQSEKLVQEAADRRGEDYKIIRLAPLVDFKAYQPPGRLGREVGPWYIAVGKRSDALSLCSVATVAEVTAAYLRAYPEAPGLLNLVEPDAPRRGDLAQRHLAGRPDLKVRWLPLPILKILSPVLVGLQALLLRGRQPINIYAAFSVEHYDATLADQVIKKACRT